MIITISGTAGSGKSSVAKMLSEKLHYKHYSIGDYRRQMAEEKGISINELNMLGEKDSSTDLGPDEWQKNLGETEDNFVIDGRLSFHFIPHSFKVFLDADIKLRAKRIYNDSRSEENFKDINEAIDMLKKRQESDCKRYKKYYDINHMDMKLYDLVLDTSGLSVEETVEKIIIKLNKY